MRPGREGLLRNAASKAIGGAARVVPARDAVLVLGARPWLAGPDALGRPAFTALQCPALAAAAVLPDGRILAAGPGREVRVLALDDAQRRGALHRHAVPLPAPCRRLAVHDASGAFLAVLGAGAALVNPFTGEAALLPLDADVAVVAGAFVAFHDAPDAWHVAVAWARGLALAPRAAAACGIDLFPVRLAGGGALPAPLLHRTPLEGAVPAALAAFNGRLLVAAGCELSLYECGHARLLRKAQTRLPSPATCLATQGLRVYAGTLRDSLLLLQYRADGPQLVLVADDPCPRGVCSLAVVDYDTVALGDRHGTFSLLRLPASTSDQVDREAALPASSAAPPEQLLAAPFKLERLADFFLGDLIVHLARCAWTPGDREALWYVTVSGAVGLFLPLPTQGAASLAQQLEAALRCLSPDAVNGAAPHVTHLDLLGRAHAAFRSSFLPCKAVVDGDLVEALVLTGPGAPLSDALKHQAVAAIPDCDKSLAELTARIFQWRSMAGL